MHVRVKMISLFAVAAVTVIASLLSLCGFGYYYCYKTAA